MSDGQCTDFADDADKQAVGLFCIVADDHVLVAQLREHCLDALPRLGKRNESRFPCLLIETVRAFKPDVGSLEKVELHTLADVALVPEDAAIMIQSLDVVEIMQVVDACLREVVGMHYAAQSGEGVEFVAEVIHTLRGTVAEVRRRVGCGSAHLTAFSSRQPAHLDRLAVDAEIILAAVYNGHHALADVLAQAGGVLSLTKSFEKCLHTSRIFPNFVKKLFISD